MLEAPARVLLNCGRASVVSHFHISLTQNSQFQFSKARMPLPSFLRVTLLKPTCAAVFLITSLLYILPRRQFPRGINATQAFKSLVSHYNDAYQHNSSLEPAALSPSFKFIDLSRLIGPRYPMHTITRTSSRTVYGTALASHVSVHEASTPTGTQMICPSHMQ